MNQLNRSFLRTSFLVILSVSFLFHTYASDRIKIVCSFSDYASIATYIAGDKATVECIAKGEQNPHFVPPKPSYAMMLNKAVPGCFNIRSVSSHFQQEI